MDWKTLYDKFYTYTLRQVNRDARAEVCRDYPKARHVYDLMNATRKAYKSDHEKVHCALLELADDIVVSNPAMRTEMLTKDLQFLYGKYMIGDIMQIVRMRNRFLDNYAKNAPRWFWCTVYSHLLLVSRRYLDFENNNQFLYDMTFCCARFGGQEFVDFVFMLLTMQQTAGFDPCALRSVLSYFLVILRDNHNLKIPVDFMYMPPATQTN